MEGIRDNTRSAGEVQNYQRCQTRFTQSRELNQILGIIAGDLFRDHVGIKDSLARVELGKVGGASHDRMVMLMDQTIGAIFVG